MNGHESTDANAAELVSHVRALIERTALGAEGPRRLRARASREQLERIQRLRRSGADTDLGPSEAAARRLVAEALGQTGLPRRIPDPDRTVAMYRPVDHKIGYPDPALLGPHRTDTATLVKVANWLRRSSTCSI
ncbi:hypothetical protein [Nocardia sp. NBC_00416]|uniref:hypothetical protein n=1 Tax=Nocardia sp. NBC_00416 TaxID=2975991 RepID=UPI002E1B0AFC